MKDTPVKVLVIEDKHDVAFLLKEMLTKEKSSSFTVECAYSLKEGLERLDNGNIDVVLLDLGLPDSQGAESLIKEQKHSPDIPVVVISGLRDKQVVQQIMEEGAQDYLAKGQVDRNILVRSIHYAIEHKQAEKALQREKELLNMIIEAADVLIVGIDLERRVILFNRKAEETTGYSRNEVMSKDFFETLFPGKEDPPLAEVFQEISAGHTAHPRDVSFISKGGEEKIICSQGTPLKNKEGKVIGVLGIGSDVTELRKVQQQLLQSEKLKSLGELSAGVAHDFNNVLTTVLGRAQILKMDLEPSPEIQEKNKLVLKLKESVEIIEQAARDGAETVRRIQEFSRRRADDKDFTKVDINELINNVLGFTRARWKDRAETKGIKIDIQKELFPLPLTLGSASELREVFTNLINNALDAMPKGGTISIKSFKENSLVTIKIGDTGVGIPKAIRDKVFDPFFTTKGVESTGLGLSISHGIINHHGGTITIDSVKGKGTTFTIKLPISEKTLGEESKVQLIPQEYKKAKILIVEDDGEVRNILSAILTKGGHVVEIASDGSEGVKLFEKKEFDLVLTDLGMPGMSGWQVAEKIKSIDGKTPVILLSGWNITLEESETNEGFIDFIIQKPFSVDQVLRLVQEAMVLRERFDKVV